MTTLRSRTLVSLVAGMIVTLSLGACAPSRTALDGPAPMEGRHGTIRFENDAPEHVHVYLIGERREWLLGRVEPGAVTTLRVPAAALSESSAFVHLAVITGERATLRAARDARATFTIAQPASEILSQQWKFSQGQLMPLRLRSARVDAGHHG